MPKEITITLRQVRESGPCSIGWNKVLKANGGTEVDFDKAFPLSTILDSNGLDDTLWYFASVPEYIPIAVDFALFCAKEASAYTDDERVHICINMVEKYLKGEVSLEELLIAGDDADTASLSNPAYTARTYAALAATNIVSIVTATGNGAVHKVSYALDSLVCAAASAATNAATSNYGEVRAAEVYKQTEYLRKLLDGEVEPLYALT